MLSKILKIAVDTLFHTSKTPLFDAEILLAHVLNKPRIFLHAWPMHKINKKQKDDFFELIKKRNDGCPVAYLTGTQEFWSMNFVVNEATLIPRPETEHLVESALTKLDKKANYQIVDLGTGSGAVGLSIAKELPKSQVFATDISQAALDVARLNANQLNIKNIQFYQGNWYDALPSQICHVAPAFAGVNSGWHPAKYDLIVSNPPYVSLNEVSLLSKEVEFEPYIALFSEENGLKDIQYILHHAHAYLKRGGYLLIEHGFLQGEFVRSLFETAGFKEIFTCRDYAGHERISGGCRERKFDERI